VKLADSRSSLQLSLVGPKVYDFTSEELAMLVPDESPWIVVRIRASEPGNSWECQGPWLELREAQRVAGWLSDLASDSASDLNQYFEEPNLEFVATRRSSDWLMTAYLDAECHSRSRGTVGRPSDSKLEISCSPASLAATSRELWADIRGLVLTNPTAYHLAPVEAWEAAPAGEPYRAASLNAEGFIHLTHGEANLVDVANAYYRRDHRLFVVLTIALVRLTSLWRYDGDDRYPHVYGPLDREAITEVRPIRREPGGSFLPLQPATLDG
jgi:uncharacterized protein (DUF952 family)